MGWFSFVPAMQCNHGVVSMLSSVGPGSVLEVDGRRIDFSGGTGYIEKDWGWSFPSTWVWHQSSEFPELQARGHRLSVMFSLASVPWYFGLTYPGYLIGVQFDDQLYDLSAYHFPEMVHLATANGTQVGCPRRGLRHCMRWLFASYLCRSLSACE